MNKSLNPFKLSARVGRSLPAGSFILADLRSEGATIGHLGGRPIPEIVIDASGHRYRYAGVAPRDAGGRFDVDCLRTGEWIVQPGLVYLLDKKAGRAGKA